MANGTHATLGKDCSPTANESIVFPKPGNLTMAKPTVTPMAIEIPKPITSLYIVTPIDTISVRFSNKFTKDSATPAGDGSDTSGQIPRTYTVCQIPMKVAMNNTKLARLSTDTFFVSDPNFVKGDLFLLSNSLLYWTFCNLNIR